LLFCTKLYTTDVHLCFRLFFTVGLVRNHYAVDPYRFGQTHIVYIIRSTAVNPTFFAKSHNPGITKSPIPNPEIGKDRHGIAILPRSTGVRRSCICTCHNCDIATTWRSFWTCESWLDEIHGQLSQWNTCRLAASHLYTSRHTDHNTSHHSRDEEKSWVTVNATITVLRPLYSSTCVSRPLQLRTGGFCWCKVLLPACPCW